MTRAVTLLDVAIEQAIARGLTAPAIAACLDVDVDRVHRVWDRLDELAEAVDTFDPERPYVPPTYSAALARERLIVEGNAAAARDRRSLLEQIVETPRRPDCGTYSAYCRHHRRWEPIDPLCKLAARDYARGARRRQRARAREQVAA